MSTQKEKMLHGELYNSMDPQLADERLKARLLQKRFNDSREDQQDERAGILKDLLPNADAGLWIQPPFYCDYGYNIRIGEGVYFNFNCIVLDVMQVKIGSRTLIGPNVQIYTATHPLSHAERASGLEYAMAIEIGEDVWIGGGTIICPGVTIGDRCVIGAGSVVTDNLTSDVLAAGNPCRIIRILV